MCDATIFKVNLPPSFDAATARPHLLNQLAAAFHLGYRKVYADNFVRDGKSPTEWLAYLDAAGCCTLSDACTRLGIWVDVMHHEVVARLGCESTAAANSRTFERAEAC